MENKIKELRERFGMISQWSAMPMDKQQELFGELCAYYDSLVFYDKLNCYTYYAHEKAYRTGYYAVQKMKTKGTKYPRTDPFKLLRRRCLPVSAPPIPETPQLELMETIFSDRMYSMATMELLMDSYERKLGRSKFSRALFPLIPISQANHQDKPEQFVEEAIEEDYIHSEDQEALEDGQMELLEVTSRRSMITHEREEHHLNVDNGPPRALEEKAEAFFEPSEVVINPPVRAKFVPFSTRPGDKNVTTHKQANYMDEQLMQTPHNNKKTTAFIPQGFHILARRYKYITWDTNGIYYPRRSYTALTFFMNRTKPPSPLSPGAGAPNGIVHIPWSVHHAAWNGDRDSIHEIILQTSIN